MALNLSGAAKKPAASSPAPQQENKKKAPMGFLMTGDAAKQAKIEAEAKAEAAKAEAGKLWRFRISEDDPEDHRITFLDGTLDEDGTLEAPMWHEHTLQLGGNWKNVPCTAKEEPCPICANNENPSLVAGFTVIDHTPFTIKNGPNAGKTVEHSRKLFVAKRTTYAQLQKLASKNGGLVGLTFDVSRNGDKSPAVGNMFDKVSKDTLADLKKEYGEIAEPADFIEEITYYTRDELIELGVKTTGKAVSSNKSKSKIEDMDEELGG
jgi:hypothetical protein